MIQKLTKFSYRFLFLAILWYRITMLWSRKKGTQVKKYEKVEDIPKAFNYGRKYRWDESFGIKSDHLTHPSRLQHRLNEESEEFGDCDDHAIYWCAALLKSGLAKKVWFAIYSMENEDGSERAAHAVCVFADKENQLYWADYRNPRKIEQAKDYMIQSASAYNKIAIAGAITLVRGLKKDDTPIFGTITRLKP